MVEVNCPICGHNIRVTLPVGRKALNIDLTFICEVLQAGHSGNRRYETVCRAAQQLGCSPAYIYKELKAVGITVVEVLTGQPLNTLEKVGIK